MSELPELVVYKEIREADLRKLLSNSADAKTGGGARDLRFPWKPFLGVMQRIFSVPGPTVGEGVVRIARLSYARGDEHRVSELEYWPPTRSRPGEGRIARVHESPELGRRPPRMDRGRVFVVLQKYSDGTVWCSYAYEEDLRTPGQWPDEVRHPILTCIESVLTQNAGAVVQGFVDLAASDSYCHASRVSVQTSKSGIGSLD